jgi:hypothetical protein
MNCIFKLAACTLVLSATVTAQATTAYPTSNGSYWLSDSVDIVEGPFAGNLLASEIHVLDDNGNGNGNKSTFTSAVYDTGNGMDFYYQLINASSSVDDTVGFIGRDFLPMQNSPLEFYQTAAAFGSFVAGTSGWVTAGRADTVTQEHSVPQTVVVLTWAYGISPGTAGFTEIIRTRARGWGRGNFTVGIHEGGGIVDYRNLYTFAPTGVVLAVPEPETYSMLLAGLGLIGAIAKRRKAKQA